MIGIGTLDISDGDTFLRVAKFLRAEAHLLDAGEFKKWLELFIVNGIYWIPSQRGQTDPKGCPSIIYEDTSILNMRIERLMSTRNYAAIPIPRTVHFLSNLELSHSGSTGDLHAESALMVVEYRDPKKRLFAGQCTHLLRPHEETFKIVMKRFELIDCDGVHDVISVPM